MKKLLALILCVCMVLTTFTVMTVFAETVNRDIGPDSTVEMATDGYEDNDAANMFDGDLDTYYMSGKVTANGADYTSSSNVVWVKLGEHEKITKIEATFGSKADRMALFGNDGNQNQNFYMYLTDFGPDEGSFNDSGIITPAGKTAVRVTNGYGNQSGYSSMKVSVNEDATFTYLAIWGPYSSGLCISDLKILADAEKKEEVIPPGATTQLVEKQITPLVADFTGNQIASAANDANNVIDGDESTMAISDGYANHLYVDLGKAYNITKIEVVYPAEADVTTFAATVGAADPVASMNTSSQVYVSADAFANGTMSGTRVNPSTNVGKGKTETYTHSIVSGAKIDPIKDLGEFRYISVTQGGGGTPTAVAEIKVYGMVEEIVGGDLVQVNKNVATEKYSATAGFGSWGAPGFSYENAGYEASKVLDSDPTTLGLGACIYNDGNNHYSGNILVIDLGQQREVTKLKLVWPTVDQYTAAKQAIGSKLTSIMNQSGVIFLTNSYPVSTELSGTTYSGTGVTLYSGTGLTAQTTLTNTDGNKYQYACIFVPYSCGLAINDVEVYANIMEAAAPAESVNVAEGKQVYSNAKNATLSGNPKAMTYEMNAVDGKSNTIFAGTTYAINEGDEDINFETVIDLGDAYKVTDVKFNPYGGETTSIYGSNSEIFDDLEAIASDVATTDKTVQEYTGINKSYRYIVVDRISAEEGALLGIRDIEVYADIQEEDVEDAKASTAGVKVGLNGDVYYTGEIRFGGAKENMNDGIYDHGVDAAGTFVLAATAGTSNYAVMDLGAAYNISAIALSQALGCSGFNNSAFKVVATNDVITDTTDLTTVEWTELATGHAFPDMNSKYLLPIDINTDYSYRYIGIKSGNNAGIPIREMDVYASAASYDLGTYTAFATGRDVTVGFTSSDGSGVDKIKVAIASYDANGALINIVIEDLSIDWTNGGYASETFNGAIAAGAASKKVFFLDVSDLTNPLANCVTL